jgi:hypothetical protein
MTAGGGGLGGLLAFPGGAGTGGISHALLTSIVSSLSSFDAGGADARLLGGAGAGRERLLRGLSSSESWSSHEGSTSIVLCRARGRGGSGAGGFGGFDGFGATLFFEATTSV